MATVLQRYWWIMTPARTVSGPEPRPTRPTAGIVPPRAAVRHARAADTGADTGMIERPACAADKKDATLVVGAGQGLQCVPRDLVVPDRAQRSL